MHSPQQVSKALFNGEIHSTSKAALQAIVEGRNDATDARQRELAALVLEYRQQWRKLHPTNGGNRTGKTGASRVSSSSLQRAFSSLPELDQDNKDEDLDEDAEEFSDTPLDEKATDIISLEEGTVEIIDGGLTEDSFSADSTYMDPYEKKIHALFEDEKKSKIHPFWKDVLLQLTRPSARSLIAQLSSDCPMGYDPTALPSDPLLSKSPEGSASTTTVGKKGTFVGYVREQKEKHPDCIILCRCGDFYETFGVDAIMLIEHCGLNAMAGKAKAGCPICNIQATLNGLTEQGFRVAVYEESPDTDASSGAGSSGGSRSRLKSRYFSQMVDPASPIYLYDLSLSGNTADTIDSAPAARPFCGVLSLAAGYTLVEVSWEERTARVSERLTAEAVACRLAAYPPADPLFYVPSPNEPDSSNLPFLPSRRELATAGCGAKLRTRKLPPDLVKAGGPSEVERAKHIVVQAVLSLAGDDTENDTENRTTVDDFTLLSTETSFTKPLYVETAQQLGLLQDRTIPPLLSYILPDAAPAATKRFLRRLLLTPPPPMKADALASLVVFFKERGPALPPLNVPPIGKVLSLLRAGQASAHVYGELLQTLESTVVVLERLKDTEPEVIESLMAVLEYETEMKGDPESLRLRCAEARETIKAVVSPFHHPRESSGKSVFKDDTSDFGDCVPSAFFERNEVWRRRVQPDVMRASYDQVAKAAEKLSKVVEEDFWLGKVGQGKNLIVQDMFNNLIALKDIPEGVSDKSDYIHPRDRFGKMIKNRYTTDRVQHALSDYVMASDRACRDVVSALAALSQKLNDEGHIPAIVQASHSNLILSSAFHHASKAHSLGWERANVREAGSSRTGIFPIHFRDVWPYWMDRKEAVGNTVDMDGMFLMTAPNMSGKSTLMRSTAVAALLSVCGLCAPLAAGSSLERFDHLFVRGASADVPTEQKSAFGAEMGDVAALLRCCGERSLVFVDELGRGTSPRDGTRLAGAVLEAMATAGMKGIFATHLHEILDLPLDGKDRITAKRMAMYDKDKSGFESSFYQWTYRLEDGVCRDSMALVTAAQFGLPESVLSRAEVLGEYLSTNSPLDKERSEKGRGSLPVNGFSVGSIPRTLSELTPLAQQMTGKEAISIQPGHSVPSWMEGCSCLYIIELDENPARFYVGETDGLSQRMEQHRSKGRSWANASAVVFRAPNKSVSREWETRLIRSLVQAGADLTSTVDGRRKRL
eukprot:scaffold21117_cov170-Amphora_coffeaeformis.AAC.2